MTDTGTETDALAGRSTFRIVADLILILSGSVFTGLLTIAPSPVLPAIAEHFGGDAKLLAQIIMVFPAAGVVVAGPIVGRMIDRYGVRRVLLFATAAYALLGITGMIVENLTVLMVSRFLLGMAGSGIYGSTFTLAGERYAGTRLAYVLGYKGAAGAGAASLTVLAAAEIADVFGWRAVFSLYLVAAIAFVLAWGIQDNIRAKAREKVATSIAPLFSMWPLFLLMVLVFAATFTTNAQGAFLVKSNGTPMSDIKFVIISGSIAYMIASAAYGFLRGFIRPQTLLRIGMTFVGLGAVGAATMTGSSLETALSFAIFGLGNGLSAPYLHGQVLERTPASVRGLASGLVSPAHYAGEFFHPLIFAAFMFSGDIHQGFIVLGIFMFIGALFVKPDTWRLADGRADASPSMAPVQVQKGTPA